MSNIVRLETSIPMQFQLEKEPSNLVSRLLNEKGVAAQSLDVIFNVIPGTHEFVERLAFFMNAIPLNDASFFNSLIQNAIKSVEPLGLFPVTIDAHISGYNPFVKSILTTSEEVLNYSITNVRGVVWRPLSGPLSNFDSEGLPLSIAINKDIPSLIHKALFRGVLLSHCTTSSQLSLASKNWVTLPD